jgi:hypothetical protein
MAARSGAQIVVAAVLAAAPPSVPLKSRAQPIDQYFFSVDSRLLELGAQPQTKLVIRTL